MTAKSDDPMADVVASLIEMLASERSDYIARLCEDDPSVGKDLAALMSNYDEASAFFTRFERQFPLPSVSVALDQAEVADPYGLVGTEVAHYRLEEYLGGGMGVVYRARDLSLSRDVALKLLPPSVMQDEDTALRFRHEASAASALDHPNVAVVHEVGTTEAGRLYIAMAFYEGETLTKKVARGPLEVDRVVDYAIGLVDGLTEAHRNGILHRDVKPSNVIVTRQGTVKLLDFGVAKVVDLSSLTATGTVLGTVAYMSPEQMRGEKVDARTDVWSAGAVMYEMMTGRRPFEANHDLAMAYMIQNEAPVDPLVYCPDAPVELAKTILWCLEKLPDDRPQNMAVLGAALRRLRPQDSLAALAADRGHTGARVAAALRSPSARWVALATIVMLGLVLAWPRFGDWMSVRSARAIALATFDVDGADRALADGLYALTTDLLALGSSRTHTAYPSAELAWPEDVGGTAGVQRVRHVARGIVSMSGPNYVIRFELLDVRRDRPLGASEAVLSESRARENVSEIRAALARVLRLNQEDVGNAAVNEALRVQPASFFSYVRARGYLQRPDDPENIDLAISLLRLSLPADSLFSLADAALSQAYLLKYGSTGDSRFMDLALESAQRGVIAGPDLAPARVALGKVLLRTGRQDEAELEFRRAVSLAPGLADAHRQLGELHYQSGELEKAEASFLTAARLRPEAWKYQNALGVFYHNIGRHEAALGPFQRVVELQPDNAWGYNNVGAQYQQLGRVDEALDWYTRASGVSPSSQAGVLQAYRNLAGFHYTADNFDTAARLFRETVRRDAADLVGWDNLGNCYARLGRADSARYAWQTVIDLASRRIAVNESDATAHDFLVEAYAKLGMTDETRTALRRFRALPHPDPRDLLTVAKVFEITGQRDSAVVYVGKALDSGLTVGAVEASIWLDELRADPAYEAVAKRAGAESSGPGE